MLKPYRGGVLLWMSKEQADIELARAADALTVETSKGTLKSINFYSSTPNNGQITKLPTSIDGYDVKITWDGVYTSRVRGAGKNVREDFAIAKVSSTLTKKTESRVFRSRYTVFYED